MLVYPEAFVTNEELEEVDGIVGEDDGERLGESWGQGALVLSWQDVALDLAAPDDGFNVVLHEFAHQIDEEFGISDGTAPFAGEEGARWAEVWESEYAKHTADVRRGRRTFVDEYGADDPGEFFAVATEHFFEEPRASARAPPAVVRAAAAVLPAGSGGLGRGRLSRPAAPSVAVSAVQQSRSTLTTCPPTTTARAAVGWQSSSAATRSPTRS